MWLRFYDCQGNLVLLPGEVVEQEQQPAQLLAAKLKELYQIRLLRSYKKPRLWAVNISILGHLI
ncbi:MAG: hypothetical protein F6K40_27780 [Okeania sp. SIO3I5]|uniref:hypothetical protein n=1 Tax=Okeania sp. SIO3I5 TaxID=2607805 RepID=UPI0013B9A04D|nr:hypothetical protein [Okeania sp. SIO3I5]NEQ39843.1 hypothetical protein [Okeania sp. SIO3I5]